MAETFVSGGRLSTARKAIRTAVPGAEDHVRTALEPILEQLHNRITLDDRLRAVAEYVGPPAERLLGGSIGVDWWIIAAKRSRNDLGHTGHTDRYSVSALGATARATEALLEMVIAKRLGAGDVLLATIVDRRHWRIAGLVSELLQPPERAPAPTS